MFHPDEDASPPQKHDYKFDYSEDDEEEPEEDYGGVSDSRSRSISSSSSPSPEQRNKYECFCAIIAMVNDCPGVKPMLRDFLCSGDESASPQRRAGAMPKQGHEHGKAAFAGMCVPLPRVGKIF